MIDETQIFWNKQTKKYDYNERQFEPVFKEVISKTKEYLSTSDEVMDFGCATGTKTLELAGATKQILGIDISDEMIREATKKKNELKIMNASFTHGTIFKNDFKKASFDKIISYGVIHLLEDSEKVIQRIHELLKPDGVFISTTACLKDKMALKNRLEFSAYLLIKRLGLFPLQLNMLKTNDVEKLIMNGKFQIVLAEKIFHGITISFVIARRL